MPRIAIVGAGPAGMAAAISAVESGCEVTLVDEAPRAGGQIYRQPHPSLVVPEVGTPQEIARKQILFAAFERVSARIDYRPQTTAHSLYQGPELQIADDEAAERLRPDAVILATGVGERCVPLPGWTLPGVLYAGGAQSLLKAHGVCPGQRLAVAGAGVLPVAVAAQLSAAGVNVVAVALLHRLNVMAFDPIGLLAGWNIVREGLHYKHWLQKARVPVLQGWAPMRVEGNERAEALVLARVDRKGRHASGESRRFEVDAIALNFGFTANSELARMAGAETLYDAVAGGWLPRKDEYGRTSVKGIYVAGDGAGLRGALVAQAEGRIVGAAAASDVLGRRMVEVARHQRTRARNERFQRAVRRTLALPSGVWEWADAQTVVCRCECVSLDRIRAAVSDGHCTLDALKRNTRAGMGWCGGRTCLQAVAAYVHDGQLDADLQPMRARPVARPVKLGALANTQTET